jgi:ribonuclease G
LPLRWFRRAARPESPPAPDQTTPEHDQPEQSEPVTDRPAAEGGPTSRARRRGTRGGRGRKKAAPKASAEAKPSARPRPAKEPTKTASRPRRPESRRRQQTRRSPLPQAKRELLVSVGVSEQRVAVLEDDQVAEVYLERPERRSIAGNVYKGSVDNVLPGMEAAFVEIGLEKNGFLYVDEIVGPELEGRGQGRRIQDLLSRGQDVLVQAVKDPMKTKGARLTTEISLPGRFVVYVPQGEGVGVSRRLEDEERTRLREILRGIDLPKGGVIVRTAAEGASEEDIERDIRFLAKIWKEIQSGAKTATAPSLVYSEAELPLRVVRDLFTGDFERALVDDDLTYKRVVGYLKKTSPHMAERVVRYREKTPLFEAYGVDAEIRSTLNRRVDLPSGGYLVFDYAEAFTVIDVNTGRFVGSRSKTSGARLEDTITKNNLEAVKEVVRQLRLRDIGGIIVIDFIDMANPKNRGQVEEELQRELERDRTKTYVVEISPLGLVEMTRQNVTEGPREILTKRCPTCSGDGIVVSEASVAVETEQRLRALAAQSPRTKAFKVEVNAHVAALLIGPGAKRLDEIERATKRRFLLESRHGVPLDQFTVLDKGTLEKLLPDSPFSEGQEIDVKLVEVGLHDSGAGVAKLDGYDVSVAGGARLVGKKVKARIERVLDGVAYATLVGVPAPESAPITAEGLAEKPTRKSRAQKAAVTPEATEAEPEPDGGAEVDATGAAEAKPKRKRTRRGSRGGRRRRKAAPTNGGAPSEEVETDAPRIHLPDPSLGVEVAAEQSGNGDEPAARRRSRSRGRTRVVAEPDASASEAPSPEAESVAADGAEPGAQPKRKRTRRGSRGGRRRRKPAAVAAGESGEAPPQE